jgi:hypothetical protein
MDKTYNIKQIDNVFELLVSSSSGIHAAWENYFTAYYKDGRERLLYFDMMEISAIIIRLFKSHKSNDLKKIFENVETILHDADAEVTNLLLAGLIEGIQQLCQYENIDMRHEFDQWLLPLTKKNWDELTGFYKFE